MRGTNADGSAAGDEFLVNTTTAGAQIEPRIAMDGSGNFVITWTSNNQDGDVYGVYAQRFDASGTKIGNEFQVNTYTTSNQRSSEIAMNSAGDFVIVWGSFGQDGSNFGVFGQLYDASGNTVGGEFQVNTATVGSQGAARVAGAAGSFILNRHYTFSHGLTLRGVAPQLAKYLILLVANWAATAVINMIARMTVRGCCTIVRFQIRR